MVLHMEEESVLGYFEEVKIKEEIHLTDEDTTDSGPGGEDGCKEPPSSPEMEPPSPPETEPAAVEVPAQGKGRNLVGWLVMDPAKDAASGEVSTFIPAPKLAASTKEEPSSPPAPQPDAGPQASRQPALILGPPQWLVQPPEVSQTAVAGPLKGNTSTGSVQVTVNGKGFKEVRRVVTLSQSAGSTKTATTTTAGGGKGERCLVKILPKRVPVVFGPSGMHRNVKLTRPVVMNTSPSKTTPTVTTSGVQLVNAQAQTATPAAAKQSTPPPLVPTVPKIIRFPGTAKEFLQLSKTGQLKGVAKPLTSVLQIASTAAAASQGTPAVSLPAARKAPGATRMAVVSSSSGNRRRVALLPASTLGTKTVTSSVGELQCSATDVAAKALWRMAAATGSGTPVTVTSSTRNSVTVAVSPSSLGCLTPITATRAVPPLAIKNGQRAVKSCPPSRENASNAETTGRKRLLQAPTARALKVQTAANWTNHKPPATVPAVPAWQPPKTDQELVDALSRLEAAEEEVARQRRQLALERSVLENDRCALDVRKRLVELDRQQLEADRAAAPRDPLGPEQEHSWVRARRSLEDELWTVEERGRVLRSRRHSLGISQKRTGQLLALAPAPPPQPSPFALHGRSQHRDETPDSDTEPPALLELPLDSFPLAVSLEEGSDGEELPLSDDASRDSTRDEDDLELLAVVKRRPDGTASPPEPAEKKPRLSEDVPLIPDRRKQRLVTRNVEEEVEAGAETEPKAGAPARTETKARFRCPMCGQRFAVRQRCQLVPRLSAPLASQQAAH